MKLLLGIIIGAALTIGLTVSAQQWGYTGQSFSTPKDSVEGIFKLRDGKVVCYVYKDDMGYGAAGGISCLDESSL